MTKKPSFKESLKQAVRQMSFQTSVDSLKKRGVQQVSVLGIDRIVALVEQAVSRSLRTKLGGIERDAVTDATKAEFLRLLRSNEDLQRQKSEIERQKELVEEELDALRRELGERQQQLQLRLDEGALDVAARYEGENAAIAARVGEVLAALRRQGNGDVEGRVVELVMELVSGERRAAEAARSALRDREVETLQRRIHKLNESLGQTEKRLQQVAATRQVDQGISSIYREVQGIGAEDTHQERKKEIMAELFKANLLLQKKRGG